MTTGVTFDLLFAAFVSGVLIFLTLWRFLSAPAAAGVAAIKTLIPALYFARYPEGLWHMIDDVLYLQPGRELLAAGYNPLSALTNASALQILQQSASGPILYWWWNLLAQWLFGIHYYAPVFLNLVVLGLTGLFMYRFGLLVGLRAGASRALAVFVVLHWDLLAWTSVMNLKDPMVLLLTLAGFEQLLRLSSPGHRLSALWKVLVVFGLLSTLRSYVPVLMIGSYALWVVMKRKRIANYVVVAVAGLIVALLVRNDLIHLSMVERSPLGFLFGVVRFLLTPQPWMIADNYRFILIPAILHWLFFLPAVLGLFLAWQRWPAFRLLIIYLAFVTAFYAVVPELSGPRQRLQVTFIWASMEFVFFYLILTPVRVPEASVQPPVPAAVQP